MAEVCPTATGERSKQLASTSAVSMTCGKCSSGKIPVAQRTIRACDSVELDHSPKLWRVDPALREETVRPASSSPRRYRADPVSPDRLVSRRASTSKNEAARQVLQLPLSALRRVVRSFCSIFHKSSPNSPNVTGKRVSSEALKGSTASDSSSRLTNNRKDTKRIEPRIQKFQLVR